MNKKVIMVSALGVLLVAALGFGIYNITVKGEPVPIAEASASTLPEEIPSSSVADIPAIVPSSIPPIPLPSSSSAAELEPEAKPAPQPSVITATPNNNGGKDYTASRPEYSQPPEDETIYDEPEDNDIDNGNGGGSNTPGGGSQGQQGGDEPQGGGNTGATPPAPDKPQGGKPGQVYVPGFGWMYPNTEPTQTTDAPNAGSGEVIGE